jgi:uncharacterized protein (PEP-CTERM system associated)
MRPRGPILWTPTVAVVEEYNDNIFLNNQDRKSDFITTVAPGLQLTLGAPDYRLSAAYRIGALFYANESQLNESGGREDLTLEGSYHLTPLLTLTLGDRYVSSVDSK